MGSSISENQFMIHVLNNLTSDYDLQLALMEKRIGDREKPLTVGEIRADLSLCFESLSMKSTKNRDVEELEEHALFSVQFKGKCRNCGQLSHKLLKCKNRSNSRHNGGNKGNTTGGIFCTYCRKSSHVKQNCFKLTNKDGRYNNNQASNSNNGNHGRENYGSQDVLFATRRPSLRSSQKTFGSVTVELVGIIATLKRVYLRLKASMRVSQWETAKA
jgi:hypothetical protein